MATRFMAGASDLPFAILRGYGGTDLAKHTNVRYINCPFSGEELAAVPALRPDVAVVHAQEADVAGNVQFWGIPRKPLAARENAVAGLRATDTPGRR